MSYTTALAIESVVAAGRPPSARPIDLFPTRVQQAFVFEAAEDRVDTSSWEVGSTNKLQSVGLLGWCVEEHLQNELRFMRALSTHDQESTHSYE